MKTLTLIFVLLIAAIQYPIWLGKGGWLQIRELNQQLEAQRAANTLLKSRNDALEAEVIDLKSGLEAVEERARAELGMVKKDEIFLQLQPAKSSTTAAAPASTAAPVSAAASATTGMPQRR